MVNCYATSRRQGKWSVEVMEKSWKIFKEKVWTNPVYSNSLLLTWQERFFAAEQENENEVAEA